MSEQPSFPIPGIAQTGETTGRYIVTFRDDTVNEGLAMLSSQASLAGLPNAADFLDSAIDLNQLESAGGAVFPTLGIAVVSLNEESLNSMMMVAGEDSPIVAIEPEPIFYALADGLPLDYLKGYRDAVNHLYEKTTAAEQSPELGAEACFIDDARSTWGLKATKVMTSRYTGKGIRLAVLDTGTDLQHPDFRGRSIVAKSFVPGEAVQDGHGHGTHCVGTSSGFKDANGRRYGVACEATIYVGKVLSNAGSGNGAWILAGMEWAIASGCQAVSYTHLTLPTKA
jgi:subtilisin family serine protease